MSKGQYVKKLEGLLLSQFTDVWIFLQTSKIGNAILLNTYLSKLMYAIKIEYLKSNMLIVKRLPGLFMEVKGFF